MKRNSTIVFVESPGAISPIPWVNGLPDFSVYQEPTLSSLQQSWQAFIDGGGVVDVIPDFEPIEIPNVLDWDGLYLSLMNSSVYSDLVIIGQQLSGVVGALDKTSDAIQYGIFKPDSIAAFPAFQSAINLLMYVLMGNQIELSTEQLQQVRNSLDTNGFTDIQLGG